MTRLVVDQDLSAKLLGFHEPVELCDESGRILARLFPAIDLSEYESWEPPIDEAELRRREAANEQRYTTGKVLAHLESL